LDPRASNPQHSTARTALLVGSAAPKIQDVANRAGVSTATVSRVTSGGSVRVSETSRRRVLDAIDELGYVSNVAARSLRTRRSHRLLVTVPDLANAFFAVVVRSVEDAAQRAGYTVVVNVLRRQAGRVDTSRHMALVANDVDGVILLGDQFPEDTRPLVAAAGASCPPIVGACQFFSELGVPTVHIGNAKAAGEMMDHLYKLGHRRIGLITGPADSPCSGARRDGAVQRARLARADDDLIVVQGDWTVDTANMLAERLLNRPDRPTAIFCLNDEMAYGALEAARRCELRVPFDVSIVGFDDLPWSRVMAGGLTTIAQPMQAIGERCVDLLLQILGGGNIFPVAVLIPHAIKIRSTSAPPRHAAGLLHPDVPSSGPRASRGRTRAPLRSARP
jgi:LacI family repressor for deo operon, udp, cdd, tsx, nupC, and nupG